MEVILGFLGRQDSATSEQIKALTNILKSLGEQEIEYVCCDMDGSTQEFIDLVGELGHGVAMIGTENNLPVSDAALAKILIDESDLVIIMPSTCHMPRKSTVLWDAARYMWKKNSCDKIKIILPDGQVLSEQGHFI